MNRYGQTQQVEVVLLHNPETVESRIWSILNAKLENINQMLREVMDDPKDMQQLVLGMAPAGFFEELFVEAQRVPKERLSQWFDSRSASFGGESVLKVVRDLVGNVSKFDFQSVCNELPRLDLPDLKPFLQAYLTLSRRRFSEEEDGLAFKTPEAWLDRPGVPDRYCGLLFDRQSQAPRARERIVGVGHPVMDKSLEEARGLEATLAACPGLAHPLVVFRVRDRVTGQESVVRFIVKGVELGPAGPSLLADWEVLARLNRLPVSRQGRAEGHDVEAAVRTAQALLETALPSLQLPFRLPETSLFAVLWPG